MLKNKFKKFVRYVFLKQTIKLPESIIFFVTSQCNARCVHCFYWQKLNRVKDLDLVEIDKISKSLGRLDSLSLSGGEPFLRPDLVEMCELFFKNNNLCTLDIPTNGIATSLIVQKTEQLLKKTDPKKHEIVVNFSVDGTSELHEAIRGVPGAFKKVILTYNDLIKLKQVYPHLKIAINPVVYLKNYKNLFELIDQLKTLTPQIDRFSFALLRGSPKDSALELPSNSELIKLYRHAQDAFSGKQSPFFRTIDEACFYYRLKVLRNKKQPVPCQAGRLLGVIDDNGDVRQCELLEPIGNLRQKSFDEIWQSNEAKIARKKIEDGECFCTHECFIFPSMISYLPSYPFIGWLLIKNWFIYKFKNNIFKKR